MAGAVNAFASDVTGAEAPMSSHSSATAYNIGRKIGHVTAMVVGTQEIEGGGGAAAGGIALAPETGGISLGMSGVGAVVMAHGGFTIKNSMVNMATGKGDDVGTYSHPQSQQPLSRDENGVPKADDEAKGAPHTQLGSQEGRKGPYNQAREFDANGKAVKDIDFTDHGRPAQHTNPHQHMYLKAPTGGTPMRSKNPQPLNINLNTIWMNGGQ